MGCTVMGEDVFQGSDVFEIHDLSANFLTNFANHRRSTRFAKLDAAADRPIRRLFFDRVATLEDENTTISTKDTNRDGADAFSDHFDEEAA